MRRDPNEETPAGESRNWWLWGSLALAVLIVGSLIFSGGSGSGTGVKGGPQAGTPHEEHLGRNLFDSAIDTLDRVEQFNTDQALRQVLDRLNQWVRLEEPNEPWELDALVETLPDEPAGLKDLSLLKTVGHLKFLPDDAEHLLETSWLRNIAQTSRGPDADDLSRATRLFDWTVRNIQLEDWSIREGRSVAYRPAKIENPRDKKHDMGLLARDVLLFGRGDYVQRAWIFMLLARQENLDVVLLAVPDKDGPHGLRPWLPALVHTDGLYLFDTYLGLPIPGPNERPATLEQVLADPALLDALDTPKEQYALARDELPGLVALVESSPAYLTRRMMAVESRLAGDKKVVLFATPALQAEKLKGAAGVSEVRLWAHPFEVLLNYRQATPEQMQTVRAARAPFMIRFPTPRMRGRGAGAAAQEQHPLFRNDDQAGEQPAAQAPLEQNWCSLWTGRMMHFKAIYQSDGAIDGANLQYLTVMVRDEDIEGWIDRFVREEGLRDPAMIQQFRQAMRDFMPLAKQNATYWLGLTSLERGKHSAAVDYFLRAKDPERDGPWRYGATYHLARTYEEQAALSEDPQAAEELLKQAIELLEQDDSAQALGNRLRARQLKAKL